MDQFDLLNREITECEKCPRLTEWCRLVAREKRKSFLDQEYWGRPVPNFGDPDATGLIVGLAPAAHGANRTGRMFTGDRSGEWLFRSLHRAGLANQEGASRMDDGLELRCVVITAVAHCAPPANKPTRDEIENCSVHFQRTLALRPWKAYLCLGGIAWTELMRALEVEKKPKFGHGVEHSLRAGTTVFGSYHPSQQNTFTGRLTEEMLDDVIARFSRSLG